jgi:hypothetical protein
MIWGRLKAFLHRRTHNTTQHLSYSSEGGPSAATTMRVPSIEGSTIGPTALVDQQRSTALYTYSTQRHWGYWQTEHITYTRLRFIVVGGNKKIVIRSGCRFGSSGSWCSPCPSFDRRRAADQSYIRACARLKLQKKKENNAEKKVDPWVLEHFAPSQYTSRIV